MSLFDDKRLTNETFKLDIERMRRGWYSDKYFENINRMLTELSAEHYTYQGKHDDLPAGISPEGIPTGDVEVEMQWFGRRPGMTVVAGVDKALVWLAPLAAALYTLSNVAGVGAWLSGPARVAFVIGLDRYFPPAFGNGGARRFIFQHGSAGDSRG